MEQYLFGSEALMRHQQFVDSRVSMSDKDKRLDGAKYLPRLAWWTRLLQRLLFTAPHLLWDLEALQNHCSCKFPVMLMIMFQAP